MSFSIRSCERFPSLSHLTRGYVLTAHVFVSRKIGALCNADTTAITAWRLFMSHNFFKRGGKKQHFKILVTQHDMLH